MRSGSSGLIVSYFGTSVRAGNTIQRDVWLEICEQIESQSSQIRTPSPGHST